MGEGISSNSTIPWQLSDGQWRALGWEFEESGKGVLKGRGMGTGDNHQGTSFSWRLPLGVTM